MEHILIVEDDHSLRTELKIFLDNNGYQAGYLESFVDPLNDILKAEPDLILLDIGIPGIHGTYLCRSLREKSSIPIIILTSSQSETDELLSLTYGADDYITKPFNPQILLLRMEGILKRMKSLNSKYLSYGNLKLNLSKCILELNETTMELSKNEMKIFSFLLKHRGTIVTREELMDDLWGSEEFIDDNTLTVNITRIRKKLKKLGYEDVIETRRGQGYIIS